MTPPAQANPFGPGLLKFLRALKRTKTRTWFEAHRDDYEADVREPALMFIRVMADHVEPGQVFLGCGMWRPEKTALAAIRQAIVDDPKGWTRLRDAKRFRDGWELGGSSLKRAPRGFPDDHPMIVDLKRTDHIAFCEFDDSFVTDPELIPKVVDRYTRSSAYLKWQADVLGLAF